MPLETKVEGQVSDPPADETKTGQELETETPAVDSSEAIIKAAEALGETAAPEGEKTEAEIEADTAAKAEAEAKAKAGEGDDTTKVKPPPYDQDPKWLAARAAEKSLNEILEEHKIGDVDELKVMLNSELKLTEILGDRDAKQLIQDAETLRQYRVHWDEQERAKEEEGLDPDERADKYKKELADFKEDQAEKEGAQKQVEGAKQAIHDYDDRVGSLVDKRGFDEKTTEFAKTFLGVQNPFNEVDIFDKKAVGTMAEAGLEKFSTFLDTVRQDAVDKYVAGKSEITPISTTETPEKVTVVAKKGIDPNASVDEVFAQARDELLEAMTGGKSV